MHSVLTGGSQSVVTAAANRTAQHRAAEGLLDSSYLRNGRNITL